MITKELVEQINILARKQRGLGLTPAEKKEQDRLRRIYLDNIRKQVISQLGSVHNQQQAKGSCTCGCHQHKHKN